VQNHLKNCVFRLIFALKRLKNGCFDQKNALKSLLFTV